MTQKIFIGADGGGTKTKVQIEDAMGNVLGKAVSGPANIRTSIQVSWQSINQGILLASHEAGLDIFSGENEVHLGLGLAGTEVPTAREQFLSVPNYFASIKLESDAYAACLGVHGGEDGAVVIMGTGVIGYCIHDDTVTTVGGWGFPHGDTGGGAWLGMEAMRLTLHWLDGRAEASPLLEAVFDFFKQDIKRVVTWANSANPSDFGQVAPLVVNYAKKNDPHAVKLMKRATYEADLMFFALEKKMRENEVPVKYCLMGGIARQITDDVCDEFKARLTPRQFDAAKGAVFMVKKAILGHI
jgi:glucosamine kinase